MWQATIAGIDQFLDKLTLALSALAVVEGPRVGRDGHLTGGRQQRLATARAALELQLDEKGAPAAALGRAHMSRPLPVARLHHRLAALAP